VKLQLLAKIVKEQKKKNEEEAFRKRQEEELRLENNLQQQPPLIKMGTIISVTSEPKMTEEANTAADT
jgi:nitrate reductase cytochrome c-type subunit